MNTLLALFWLFLKVNLLSTSGIASVGLLHQEAVGRFVTQSQFVQAVSFSSVLPGSDALQMAMFIGFRVDGLAGSMAALLGSILPPTVLILGIVSVLHRLRREAWVSRFVEGLAPAVAVLMVYVAFKLLAGGLGEDHIWQLALLAAGSFIALVYDASPPVVLLIAGALGILIYR